MTIEARRCWVPGTGISDIHLSVFIYVIELESEPYGKVICSIKYKEICPDIDLKFIEKP